MSARWLPTVTAGNRRRRSRSRPGTPTPASALPPGRRPPSSGPSATVYRLLAWPDGRRKHLGGNDGGPPNGTAHHWRQNVPLPSGWRDWGWLQFLVSAHGTGGFVHEPAVDARFVEGVCTGEVFCRLVVLQQRVHADGAISGSEGEVLGKVLGMYSGGYRIEPSEEGFGFSDVDAICGRNQSKGWFFGSCCRNREGVVETYGQPTVVQYKLLLFDPSIVDTERIR